VFFDEPKPKGKVVILPVTNADKKKAVIFGHSHVWSIRRALAAGWAHSDVIIKDLACGTKELPGSIVYRSEDGRTRINSVILSIIHRISSSKCASNTSFVSMVEGNYYNRLGMFVEGAIFDFVLKEHVEIPLTPGATVLPTSAVIDALEAQMKQLRDFLPALVRETGGKRIIVVGPPPPSASNTLITKRLKTESESLSISPASVRLKLWVLQNQLVGNYCKKNGIQYLSGDLTGTLDSAGYTRLEFMKDSVHPNHTYANHLLNAIAEYIV